MDRFVFTCSKCSETIILPGLSQKEAAEFLFDKTPWTGKATVDNTALLCPAHNDLSPEEANEEEEGGPVIRSSIRNRHFCKWKRLEDREAPTLFGKGDLTHTNCVESGDGRFWFDLCEDIVLVRACPICGEEAPVKTPPRQVPVVGPLAPNDPSSVAAYAMRSGHVSRGVPAARWVVQSHCSTVSEVATAIEKEHHMGAQGIGFSTANGMKKLFEERYDGEFEPDDQ